MDMRKLADRAKAELAQLSAGLDIRAALHAADTAELGPGMLVALLAHELVTGHATMMKLSTRLDRWLALMSDDRSPEDQDRGARESVRLAVAASRLSERYRLGVLSLARLKGWDGFAAAGRRRAVNGLLADPEDDDDPHDGPDGGPGGGTRALLAALQRLQAVQRPSGNGHAKPNGTTPHGPPPDAHANRGKLRHGNPSGDFLAAPRCGTKTRAGCACRQPAMGNGRCRLHGGKSTGARTAAGLARVRANRLVHGARSAEIIDLHSAAARHGRNLRTLARLAKASVDPQSERSTPCPATLPASVAAPAKGTTDEHRCAQMNTDGIDAQRRRSASASAFIASYLRSSVVKPSSAGAPDPRSERPTPCPATRRRAATG